MTSATNVITIDVHAAKELIKSGHYYIDVRAEEDFKKGHVGGAEKILNIPYLFNTPEGRVKNPEFMSQMEAACNKDDHLIVGCQTGGRSVSATSDLLNNGFKEVQNMGGGYRAWVEKGFPVNVPQQEL